MKQRVKLAVAAMKCAGCVSAIEKALGAEANVATANVDLATKTVLVETSLSQAALAKVIKTAGFEVTNVTIDSGSI